MDTDTINRLLYEKEELECNKRKYKEQLNKLESYQGYKIKMNIKRGKIYYYLKKPVSDSYKYIGTGDSSVISRIKEAAHAQAALERIDNNLSLVSSLLEEFCPYDYSSIDQDLPVVYQDPDLYPEQKYHIIGKKWKDEQLKYQAAFPENYPEKKNETTSDGTMVKSKNEVIIYDRLLSSGLSLVYELPLVLNDFGPPIYPDFTVLSPIDMKTVIIIEHIGRLDDQKYRDDFIRKLGRYIKAGYQPGVNLFFTFNDLHGHFDQLQITKIIADIWGMR